jgi:hypothetical protein
MLQKNLNACMTPMWLLLSHDDRKIIGKGENEDMKDSKEKKMDRRHWLVGVEIVPPRGIPTDDGGG